MDMRTVELLQKLEGQLSETLDVFTTNYGVVGDEPPLRQLEVLAQVAQALTLNSILNQLYEMRVHLTSADKE